MLTTRVDADESVAAVVIRLADAGIRVADFAIPFDPNTVTTRGTAVPVLDDVAHESAVGVGQFDVSAIRPLVYRRDIGARPRGGTCNYAGVQLTFAAAEPPEVEGHSEAAWR